MKKVKEGGRHLVDLPVFSESLIFVCGSSCESVLEFLHFSVFVNILFFVEIYLVCY